jgi:monovalent cation:H+ antiporter-2, CPA2 family
VLQTQFEAGLLVNLVLALGAGLAGSLIALRLRQSVILGYIVAGIAIGPFTPGLVGDLATVQALAEIGIIFLMFAIGVQVSLSQLARVGRIAAFGGLAQVAVLVGLGYLVGIWLGWPPLEALFFGAVVSNSSSTVISKMLGEQGEVDSEHGRTALAWSSIQDLTTVLFIVLVSALGTGGDFDLVELAWAVGMALLFLLLLVPIGLRALPFLFDRVAAFRSREVFILTVTAVALGTAYIASLFGISLALGAFIAGVVVSESDLSHQILGEIAPLRDLFAGLFFVSVGMLVNPFFVAGAWPLVLAALVLIVLVKGAVAALLTFAGRRSVRTALLVGVALGQSAEFSFLLASLGLALGAITADTFSLLLAAAAVSIVLAPNLYAVASGRARWLEERLLPLGWEDPEQEGAARRQLRGHVVICGYGRVGSTIGAALNQLNFPFVVIDEDPRKVRRLRTQGQMAFLGNAARPNLLERADIERARVLVVAMPDPLAARQIVDYAKQRNPRIDIVVRTHSGREREALQQQGVDEAVLGELELALEMTRHTIRRFGLSSTEAQAIISGLRRRG